MTLSLRVGGVPEHFNLPWRLALADDAFTALGIQIDYRDVPAGTGELTRQLRDNELDVALVLTEGAVNDCLQHGKNRLVKVFVNSPLIWGIHVAGKSDLKDVADCQGKRIAISRYGSGSHLIAIVDAATRGWPTEDLQFVVVDNLDGARQALATGAADVFLWERHMTQPLVDSGEFRRIAQRKVPWPAFVVSVRQPLLKLHAQKLREALDCVARYADNLRRRKSAAELIAERYSIQKKDADAWLATVRWGQSYRRPASVLQRVMRALNSQGVIDAQSANLNKIWYQL